MMGKESGLCRPYSPIKMVYGQAMQAVEGDNHSWAPGSGINNNTIRFSDVLLMAAEAEAQTGNINTSLMFMIWQA
jgi:hypothetical protein